MKPTRSTPLPNRGYSQSPSRPPSTIGAMIDDWLITTALCPWPRSLFRSRSSPIRNMNITRPIWARTFRAVMISVGNR